MAVRKPKNQRRLVKSLLVSFLFLIVQNAWSAEKQAKAIFAGGCFWCMQPPFDSTAGVISTRVGYTGGTIANPTYQQVSHEHTGHKEAIEVVFDPQKVNYEKLLDIFWHNVDPLDSKGQFCDKGDQYKSAIFYLDESQKKSAEETLKKVQEKLKTRGSVQTEIVKAQEFYSAEIDHQKYYEKNPIRYKFYRRNCGRDQRLKDVWGAESGGH